MANVDSFAHELAILLKKFFGPGVDVPVDPNLDLDAAEMDWSSRPIYSTSVGDPVPVTIVSDKPADIAVNKSAIGWTGAKVLVTANGTGNQAGPQMIAAMSPRRQTVVIVHKGMKNIAVGHTNNVKFASGNPNGAAELAPGDVLTLDTIAEIWAIADPTSMGEMIMVYQTFWEGGV